MRKSALCLGLLAFGLLNTLPAFGQQNPVVITRHPATVDSSTFSSLNMKQKHMAFNKLSASTNAATQKQDPRIVSVPNFTRSFTFGGQTFPYTMVGQDPTKAQPTEVPTQYIPMSFFFDEFIDQNGNNIVIDTTAITDEIKHSPLFDSAPFANGFTQYEDAQMRAEFFPLFHNKIHNGFDGDDSFHVLLGHPQTLLPVQIEVPVGSSEVFVDSNGTFFALIDINFIVSQLNTLLQTEPITVQSIPIFLTRNAVYGDFFQQQPVDCCIGGFHTAFETNQINNKIFVQTFAFSTSLDSDVSAACVNRRRAADRPDAHSSATGGHGQSPHLGCLDIACSGLQRDGPVYSADGDVALHRGDLVYLNGMRELYYQVRLASAAAARRLGRDHNPAVKRRVLVDSNVRCLVACSCLDPITVPSGDGDRPVQVANGYSGAWSELSPLIAGRLLPPPWQTCARGHRGRRASADRR